MGLAAVALGGPRLSLAGNELSLSAQIDEGMRQAVGFLAAKQAADGAWRSDVYGPLKDGPSLTAFIATTLTKIADDVPVEPVLSNAVRSLASMDPHGSVITYPVYAAAGAVTALSRQAANRCVAARDAWLAFLRRQQLVETCGWQECDDSFGGWSFAHEPPAPIDGRPSSPLAVPNLSATVFALDALCAAGCSDSDESVQKALVFVRRCQNWPTDASAGDQRFDDGGFFFLNGDPIRNKPGEAGVDSQGRTRYHSYGSTTADGLRALIACGLPLDHPRVLAARSWLLSHFSPEKHPGDYPAEREHLRPALYYYYAASIAEALLASRADHGQCEWWGASLSKALLGRQKSDGSWTNAAVDVREDDPLVATPLGLCGLVCCKAALRHVS